MPDPVPSGSQSPALAFMAGDSEMARLMRAFDWNSHPLGHPEHWSASLKAMVRMLLNTQHPVIIHWGPRSYLFYNDAFAASLGPEKHPASLGRSSYEAWSELWPTIGPQIDLVLRGGGATWHENQLVPIVRHGRLCDVYWTYSFGPIDDETAPGGIGGVLVLCTETTPQVALNQRLAHERSQFATLFDQSPSFMALLRGPEHVLELTNPAYQRLLGHRPVLGRPVAEAIPEAAAQGYLALLDQVYRSGVAYTARSSPLSVRRPGERAPSDVFLDFVYQPLVDERGQVTGIFVQGVDVTERHRAEQALRDADRRKDEYLATLAHELRNPLAAVRASAHLLARRKLAPEQVARWTEVIVRQTASMASLLDDLLDAARIGSGKLDLQLRRVRLQAVVDDALEAARATVESRQHHLTVAIDQPDAELDCDPLRLAQVLTNLVTNAAKYTEPAGRIALDTVVTDDSVCITVRDNGLGIPVEALPRIFEMFHQVRGASDRATGGLGIGLALSRSLVHLHGGDIQAFSDGPGKGSTFQVSLPRHALGAAVAADDSASLADQPKAAEPTPLPAMRPQSNGAEMPLTPAPEGAPDGAAAPTASAPESDAGADTVLTPALANLLHVLVADDNTDAANALAQVLQLDGHHVRVAIDGLDAWQQAQQQWPDACVLDLGMPGLDGFQLAARLRAQPGGPALFLIALTGWGQAADRERSRAAGFDLHLTKPAEPYEVAACVRRHAATRRRAGTSPRPGDPHAAADPR